MKGEVDIHEVADRAAPVLRAAGVSSPFGLERLTGGGNNRVYRVDSAGAPVVLKLYFRHAADPRDRLRADFGYSSFAWNVGVRALPKPLAIDHEAGMAAYEHVQGRKLALGELTRSHVAEAADFFRLVNEHREHPHAIDLSEASEACFSVASHVDCVDVRVKRLSTIAVDSPLGSEAADLVACHLGPTWRRVRERVRASQLSSTDRPLAASERCLSPSDFGFHNAIVATDGGLRFLDFEYSGWDDPAKMVCDFFCQPAVPVSRNELDFFVDRIGEVGSMNEVFSRRVGLLLPVYELKWCCIMLNEFLAVGESRRSFAGMAGNRELHLAHQLDRVRRALGCIEA
jgi:hypothetical protein